MVGEGVAWKIYEEALCRHTTVTVRYVQISQVHLAPRAEEYLETGNVLAAALAAIMG